MCMYVCMYVGVCVCVCGYVSMHVCVGGGGGGGVCMHECISQSCEPQVSYLIKF